MIRKPTMNEMVQPRMGRRAEKAFLAAVEVAKESQKRTLEEAAKVGRK